MCRSLNQGQQLLREISELNENVLSPLENAAQSYREDKIPHSMLTLSLDGRFSSDRLPDRFVSRFTFRRTQLLEMFFWELAIESERDTVRQLFLERDHTKVFKVEFDSLGSHGGLVHTCWIIEPNSPNLSGLSCLVTCEADAHELLQTTGVRINSVFFTETEEGKGIMIGVISVYEVDGVYPFFFERQCRNTKVAVWCQYGSANLGVYPPKGVNDSATEYELDQSKRLVINKNQKHYLRFNKPACLTLRLEGEIQSILNYFGYGVLQRS